MNPAISIDPEKPEFVVTEDVGALEAQDGDKVQTEDAVHAAALVPIGGLTLTAEEAKMHRATNLRYDLTVLPLLTLLYLFNGLDRSNLGNAATVKFYNDLGIPAEVVNNATICFTGTFVAIMPLSTWLGKKVGFHNWIPSLMIGWGVFTLTHAFIQNSAQLYAFRLMIGVFEGGYYPSVAYYLASCYLRYDFAMRISIFYGAYSLAGAFSGLIAYGILQLDGRLHSWQYLFIIEGVATISLAIIAWFMLPSHASRAWFLNQEQRDWAVERMHRDSGGEDYQKKGISRRDVILAFTDWKIWLLWPAGIVAGLPQSAFSVFLPLIVQALGYKGYDADLYAVPIYVVGCAGLIVFAWISDRYKERMILVMVSLGITIVGQVLIFTLKSEKGRYASLCIMQIGNFAHSPLVVALIANNTPTPGHRAMLFSINSTGNLGGIISAKLFLPKYAPTYSFPFKVSLGLACFAWADYFVYRVVTQMINASRKRQVARATPEEIEHENSSDERLGDKKWTFQYTT